MADTPVMTMADFLKSETNFEELIEKLSFVEESAAYAASEQPTLFIKASRARVQTMRDRARAEATLDEMEAEKGIFFRQHAAATGQKSTDKSVAEQVLLDPEVRQARTALRTAEAREELGKLLVEAYKHRRDAIRIISDANLAEGNSPMGEEQRFAAHQKVSKDARAITRQRRIAAMVEDDAS